MRLESASTAAIGIDGCRAGWVAVTIDGAARSFRFHERFEDLVRPDGAIHFVDMPIGLPEAGHRGCDRAARDLLGGTARSRVFLGVRRGLLDHRDDYAAANAWGKANGAGVSRQLHGILRKIQEIDALMSPERQSIIREAHPELIFQRLNDGEALPPKKSPHGAALRRRLLVDAGFDALDQWLAERSRQRWASDDVLDACACALAARDATDSRRLPAGVPLVDGRGLSMEIWY